MSEERFGGMRSRVRLLSYVAIRRSIHVIEAEQPEHLLTHKEKRGNAQGAALIQQISPVAWQHIDFYGRYEFTKGPEPINIDAVVEELSHLPVSQDLTL